MEKDSETDLEKIKDDCGDGDRDAAICVGPQDIEVEAIANDASAVSRDENKYSENFSKKSVTQCESVLGQDKDDASENTGMEFVAENDSSLKEDKENILETSVNEMGIESKNTLHQGQENYPANATKEAVTQSSSDLGQDRDNDSENIFHQDIERNDACDHNEERGNTMDELSDCSDKLDLLIRDKERIADTDKKEKTCSDGNQSEDNSYSCSADVRNNLHCQEKEAVTQSSSDLGQDRDNDSENIFHQDIERNDACDHNEERGNTMDELSDCSDKLDLLIREKERIADTDKKEEKTCSDGNQSEDNSYSCSADVRNNLHCQEKDSGVTGGQKPDVKGQNVPAISGDSEAVTVCSDDNERCLEKDKETNEFQTLIEDNFQKVVLVADTYYEPELRKLETEHVRLVLVKGLKPSNLSACIKEKKMCFGNKVLWIYVSGIMNVADLEPDCKCIKPLSKVVLDSSSKKDSYDSRFTVFKDHHCVVEAQKELGLDGVLAIIPPIPSVVMLKPLTKHSAIHKLSESLHAPLTCVSDAKLLKDIYEEYCYSWNNMAYSKLLPFLTSDFLDFRKENYGPNLIVGDINDCSFPSLEKWTMSMKNYFNSMLLTHFPNEKIMAPLLSSGNRYNQIVIIGDIEGLKKLQEATKEMPVAYYHQKVSLNLDGAADIKFLSNRLPSKTLYLVVTGFSEIASIDQNAVPKCKNGKCKDPVYVYALKNNPKGDHDYKGMPFARMLRKMMKLFAEMVIIANKALPEESELLVCPLIPQRGFFVEDTMRHDYLHREHNKDMNVPMFGGSMYGWKTSARDFEKWWLTLLKETHTAPEVIEKAFEKYISGILQFDFESSIETAHSSPVFKNWTGMMVEIFSYYLSLPMDDQIFFNLDGAISFMKMILAKGKAAGDPNDEIDGDVRSLMNKACSCSGDIKCNLHRQKEDKKKRNRSASASHVGTIQMQSMHDEATLQTMSGTTTLEQLDYGAELNSFNPVTKMQRIFRNQALKNATNGYNKIVLLGNSLYKEYLEDLEKLHENVMLLLTENLKVNDLLGIIQSKRTMVGKKALWILVSGIWSVAIDEKDPMCDKCLSSKPLLKATNSFKECEEPLSSEMKAGLEDLNSYIHLLQKELGSEGIIILAPPIPTYAMISSSNNHKTLHEMVGRYDVPLLPIEEVGMVKNAFDVFCAFWNKLACLIARDVIPSPTFENFCKNNSDHNLKMISSKPEVKAHAKWTEFMENIIQMSSGKCPSKLRSASLASGPMFERIIIVGYTEHLEKLQEKTKHIPVSFIDEKLDLDDSLVAKILRIKNDWPGNILFLIMTSITNLGYFMSDGNQKCAKSNCQIQLPSYAMKFKPDGDPFYQNWNAENMIQDLIELSAHSIAKADESMPKGSKVLLAPLVPVQTLLMDNSFKGNHKEMHKAYEKNSKNRNFPLLIGKYGDWSSCCQSFNKGWLDLLRDIHTPYDFTEIFNSRIFGRIIFDCLAKIWVPHLEPVDENWTTLMIDLLELYISLKENDPVPFKPFEDTDYIRCPKERKANEPKRKKKKRKKGIIEVLAPSQLSEESVAKPPVNNPFFATDLAPHSSSNYPPPTSDAYQPPFSNVPHFGPGASQPPFYNVPPTSGVSQLPFSDFHSPPPGEPYPPYSNLQPYVSGMAPPPVGVPHPDNAVSPSGLPMHQMTDFPVPHQPVSTPPASGHPMVFSSTTVSLQTTASISSSWEMSSSVMSTKSTSSSRGTAKQAAFRLIIQNVQTDLNLCQVKELMKIFGSLESFNWPGCGERKIGGMIMAGYTDEVSARRASRLFSYLHVFGATSTIKIFGVDLDGVSPELDDEDMEYLLKMHESLANFKKENYSGSTALEIPLPEHKTSSPSISGISLPEKAPTQQLRPVTVIVNSSEYVPYWITDTMFSELGAQGKGVVKGDCKHYKFSDYTALVKVLDDFKFLDLRVEVQLDNGDKDKILLQSEAKIGAAILKRPMQRLMDQVVWNVKKKLDKELNVYTFKTEACLMGMRCKDQFNCPRYHDKDDRRRSLVSCSYSVINCNEMGVTGACHLEDKCKKLHSIKEKVLHFDVYKSEICPLKLKKCQQGKSICYDAHTDEPDSFYNSAWEQPLYIKGLEKTIDYLAGAVRNLFKFPNLTCPRVLLITSTIEKAKFLANCIKDLAVSCHQTVAEYHKKEDPCNGSVIIASSIPPAPDSRADRGILCKNIYLQRLKALIIDDGPAVLRNVSKNKQSTLKLFNETAGLNIVVTAEEVIDAERNHASEMLGLKQSFKIMSFLGSDAADDPRKQDESSSPLPKTSAMGTSGDDRCSSSSSSKTQVDHSSHSPQLSLKDKMRSSRFESMDSKSKDFPVRLGASSLKDSDDKLRHSTDFRKKRFVNEKGSFRTRSRSRSPPNIRLPHRTYRSKERSSPRPRSPSTSLRGRRSPPRYRSKERSPPRSRSPSTSLRGRRSPRRSRSPSTSLRGRRSPPRSRLPLKTQSRRSPPRQRLPSRSDINQRHIQRDLDIDSRRDDNRKRKLLDEDSRLECRKSARKDDDIELSKAGSWKDLSDAEERLFKSDESLQKIWEVFIAAFDELKLEYNRELELYTETPEVHPEYEEKYSDFIEQYKKNFTEKNDVTHCETLWEIYWKKCVSDMLEEEYRNKVKDLRKELIIPVLNDPGLQSKVIAGETTEGSDVKEDSLIRNTVGLMEAACPLLGEMGQDLMSLICKIQACFGDKRMICELFQSFENIRLLKIVQEKCKEVSARQFSSDSEQNLQLACVQIQMFLDFVEPINTKEKRNIKLQASERSAQKCHRNQSPPYKSELSPGLAEVEHKSHASKEFSVKGTVDILSNMCPSAGVLAPVLQILIGKLKESLLDDAHISTVLADKENKMVLELVSEMFQKQSKIESDKINVQKLEFARSQVLRLLDYTNPVATEVTEVKPPPSDYMEFNNPSATEVTEVKPTPSDYMEFNNPSATEVTEVKPTPSDYMEFSNPSPPRERKFPADQIGTDKQNMDASRSRDYIDSSFASTSSSSTEKKFGDSSAEDILVKSLVLLEEVSSSFGLMGRVARSLFQKIRLCRSDNKKVCEYITEQENIRLLKQVAERCRMLSENTKNPVQAKKYEFANILAKELLSYPDYVSKKEKNTS